MTNKELLYVEDAVNHEISVISYLESQLDNLNDESIIEYFNEEINVHDKYLKELLGKMEALINEWQRYNYKLFIIIKE